jgi:hypothetical protein
MDRDGYVMLERKPAVTGDVVGVGMRLQDPEDPDVVVGREVEVLLDGVRRVDHQGFATRWVADHVGGAAKIVVDELAEQHDGKLTPGAARFLEALGARSPKWHVPRSRPEH